MTDTNKEAHGPGRTEPKQAAKITRAITWVSVMVALVLMVSKLLAFIITGSVALLASFADSALDFFASITAFFAVRYAAEPADEEHRFGHGKAET
ncbi:MAG: cation transporter [Alphaproteobacteria bacterium]|nr:cation transporter [Alphaproteobacteria bacterium]